MATPERNQEAAIVAKMVANLADSMLKKGLLYNGEYIAILNSIAYTIQREGGNGCFNLESVIRDFMRDEYGLPAGPESKEVKTALQSL